MDKAVIVKGRSGPSHTRFLEDGFWISYEPQLYRAWLRNEKMRAATVDIIGIRARLTTAAATLAKQVSRRSRNMLIAFEKPLFIWFVAAMIYALFAFDHGGLFYASHNAYYNYLADAFLHGQLYLRQMPPSTHDLTFYHGHYYLYWGPLPSVLMMPLVALFGVGLSDRVLMLLLSATNVALVATLLRLACKRNLIRVSEVQRALLVLFFAFGTVHMTLAPLSNVWSTDELAGFFWVLVAYLAAIGLTGKRAFLLTGLALTGALLTRNHLVLTGVAPAAILIYNHREWGVWRVIRNLVLAGAPIVLGVVLIGLYDLARFGSVFDNGIAYHLMDSAFVSDFHHYGYFSLHYVPINLYYQYIFYPFPIRPLTLMGGSLFLLSPVFFGFFQGLFEGRPRWLVGALLGSVLLTAVPILLLMGTGWKQFGPRYTLDFTVPLLLLTALGIRRWPNWLLGLFTVAAIAQYVVGTILFITI